MKLRSVRGALAKHYIQDLQIHAAIASVLLLIASVMVIASAPSLRSRPGAPTLAERLPDGFASLLGLRPDLSFDSAAGHMDAWMISLAAPLVLCALALPAAVNAIAGCEATGQMEWLAAQPIQRSQIVVERFVAITFVTIEAAVPATIVLAVGGNVGELELSPTIVVESMLRVVVLVSLLAGIVLVASAVTGSPELAASVGFVAPIAAFGLILGGESTAKISPVRWTLGATPAAGGGAVIGVVAAVTITAVCLLIASAGFQRRDIIL